MNETHRSFRERLLAAEKSLPSEKYRKELAQLLERKLPPSQRAVITAVSMGSLASAILMGWLAVSPPHALPRLARVGLAVGAMGGLVLATLAGVSAKRGTMRLEIDPVRITNVLFAVLVCSATIMLVLMNQASDVRTQVAIGLNALMMLGIGSLFLLVNRLEQSELRTRERLIEIAMEVQKVAEEVRAVAGRQS